jgi:hypothetical protein
MHDKILILLGLFFAVTYLVNIAAVLSGKTTTRHASGLPLFLAFGLWIAAVIW